MLFVNNKHLVRKIGACKLSFSHPQFVLRALAAVALSLAPQFNIIPNLLLVLPEVSRGTP